MVRDVTKKLGERDSSIRPMVEVGGKLAVRNLHQVRAELIKALQAGFKKRELMVFRQATGDAKLFMIAGFAAKYVSEYPDMVGELLERGQWLADHGKDRDMLYVNVTDAESGTYEIGFLDQPKRVTHSVANHLGNRAKRRALGLN